MTIVITSVYAVFCIAHFDSNNNYFAVVTKFCIVMTSFPSFVLGQLTSVLCCVCTRAHIYQVLAIQVHGKEMNI